MSFPYPDNDPRHATNEIKGMLDAVVKHARDTVGTIEDPKAQALLETTAEVLRGLSAAYDHYEHKSERAWQ